MDTSKTENFVKKIPLATVVLTGGIFLPQTRQNFYAPKIFIFQALVILGYILLSASQVKKGKIATKSGSLPIFALAYLGLVFLASRENPTPFLGQAKTFESITWISFILLVWLVPIAAQELEFTLTTLEFVTIPLVLYGFAQHFSLDYFSWNHGNTRIFSLIGNADFFANILSILMAISFVRFFSKPTFPRFFLLEGELVALFWSFTRGPYPAFFISILAFVFIAWKTGEREKIRHAIIGLLPFLATFAVLFFLSRGTSVGNRFAPANWKESHDILARGYLLRKGMEVVASHPWTGVGPGNFKEAYLVFRYNDPIFLRDRLAMAESTHNTFMDAFAETGIPGGIIFIAIWCSALLPLFGKAMERSSSQKNLSLLLFISLLTAFINLQFIYPDPATEALIGLLMGGTGVLAEKSISLITSPKVFRIACAFLFFLSLLWGVHAGRVFIGEWIAGKGMVLFNSGAYPQSAALFSIAAHWDLWDASLDQFSGKSFELSLNPKMALTYYSRAILIQENNPYLWGDLGRLAGENGWKGISMQAFKNALTLDPYNPFFAHDAAYAAFSFGLFRLSRLYAENAWHLDPGNSSNVTLFASSLIKTGEKQEALAVVKKALQAFPKDPNLIKLNQSIGGMPR